MWISSQAEGGVSAHRRCGLPLPWSACRERKGHGSAQAVTRPCHLLFAGTPLPSWDQEESPRTHPPGTLWEGRVLSDAQHLQWVETGEPRGPPSTPGLEYVPIQLWKGIRTGEQAFPNLSVAADPTEWLLWLRRGRIGCWPCPPHSARRSSAGPLLNPRPRGALLHC